MGRFTEMHFTCETCDGNTLNVENEYGEHICDDCEQNAAERGWESFCSDFYGGSDPLTIREKQVAAWRLK